MLVRQITTDARTGESAETWVEGPDACTVAAGVEFEREEHNATICAEMDAADLRIMRAVIAGDAGRIAQHKIDQAERRARLK